MAYRKTLAHRLSNITKISSSNPILTQSLISSPSFQTLIPSIPAKTTFNRCLHSVPDSGNNGFFRRFFQSATSPEIRSLPLGDKLIEMLKSLNLSRDRIRLEGLNPVMSRSDSLDEISVEETRKLLKVAQLEMLKSALRGIQKSCVSYSEFAQICVDGSSSREEGLLLAKMLDQSGIVIVLGNIVYLRPEQITKVIMNLIPVSIANPNDPRKKELEKMEREKAAIDEKAEDLVRKELWCGLGFLVIQTAGFMRLTFWELSWDVMEPICFYVTSFYFMAGYAFFLRTSRDPSFEGFFESRFSAKQKRLMKTKNFDLTKFNELQRICCPSSWASLSSSDSDTHSDRTLLGGMHH